MKIVRKCYLTSEVAANFIEILKSLPADNLPAPCDFFVDNKQEFKNQQMQ